MAGILPLPQRETESTQPSMGAPQTMTPLEKYNEETAVNMSLSRMPQIKTVGNAWYQYENGTWRPTSRDPFRPVALSVLSPAIKSDRRARDILNHIESLRQVSAKDLKGFYTFESGSTAVLLNAANGIIRVSPGTAVQLLPHDAAQNFTRQLESSYDPNAECPNFERVVLEALPDEGDRKLLQLFAGSILLPSSKFEAALVCYGPGGTGKSTIAEAIVSIFGNSLVERIGMNNICDTKGYHLPNLKYAAVNLGTEVDAREIQESGNFKALVSGEQIAVRPIYGAPFRMDTSVKLWFLSNNMPRFKHGTDAEVRRLRFLRFDRKPATKDVNLKRLLNGEREGISQWVLKGLLQLLQLEELPHGGPESRAAAERFSVANDPLGAFIAAQCVFNPNARVPKDHFREAFNEFCDRRSIAIYDDTVLFRHLWNQYPQLDDGQATASRSRIRVIKGIDLK